MSALCYKEERKGMVVYCVSLRSVGHLCPLEKIMRQGQVSVQAGELTCSVKSLRALLKVSVTEKMLQTQW